MKDFERIDDKDARLDEAMARITAAACSLPGFLPAGMRRDVFAERPQDEPVQTYVQKVHAGALDVSDEDIRALLEVGYSQDEIFELTVAAAVGAGMKRHEKAMALLDEDS